MLNPTPVALNYNNFSNYAHATLYVPQGSMAAYKANYEWNKFKEIKEILARMDLVDGENYTYDDGATPVATVTYSRTYKNKNWQPWYVPFDMTLTSDILANFSFGKFAGTYTEEDGTFYLSLVRLKAGDKLKANTPYFIQAKKADSNNAQVITVQNTTLYPAESASFSMFSAEKKITVTGIYEQKVVTETDRGWYAYSGGQYSQQNKLGNKLGSFRFFVTIEYHAESPYRVTPNPSEVKIRVLGENKETGIDCHPERSEGSSPVIYDLQGRKVEKTTKGIYIVNGKKMLFK